MLVWSEAEAMLPFEYFIDEPKDGPNSLEGEFTLLTVSRFTKKYNKLDYVVD